MRAGQCGQTEMQAETKRKHCAKYFLEAYVTKQKQDLLGKGKGAGGNEHAREKDKEEKKKSTELAQEAVGGATVQERKKEQRRW